MISSQRLSEETQDSSNLIIEVDVAQLEENFDKDDDLKDSSSLTRKVEEAKEVRLHFSTTSPLKLRITRFP